MPTMVSAKLTGMPMVNPVLAQVDSDRPIITPRHSTNAATYRSPARTPTII